MSPDKARSVGEIARGMDALNGEFRAMNDTLLRIEVQLAADHERLANIRKEVNELRELPWKAAALVSTLITIVATFVKGKFGMP